MGRLFCGKLADRFAGWCARRCKGYRKWLWRLATALPWQNLHLEVRRYTMICTCKSNLYRYCNDCVFFFAIRGGGGRMLIGAEDESKVTFVETKGEPCAPSTQTIDVFFLVLFLLFCSALAVGPIHPPLLRHAYRLSRTPSHRSSPLAAEPFQRRRQRRPTSPQAVQQQQQQSPQRNRAFFPPTPSLSNNASTGGGGGGSSWPPSAPGGTMSSFFGSASSSATASAGGVSGGGVGPSTARPPPATAGAASASTAAGVAAGGGTSSSSFRLDEVVEEEEEEEADDDDDDDDDAGERERLALQEARDEEEENGVEVYQTDATAAAAAADAESAAGPGSETELSAPKKVPRRRSGSDIDSNNGSLGASGGSSLSAFSRFRTAGGGGGGSGLWHDSNGGRLAADEDLDVGGGWGVPEHHDLQAFVQW